MKRADFGGERYEMTEFQRKVRMNSDKLRNPSWLTVSADGTLDEVRVNFTRSDMIFGIFT